MKYVDFIIPTFLVSWPLLLQSAINR